MGQRFNTKGDTETIRLISDNPGITCKVLAAKLSISLSGIQYRIQRMCNEGRVFKQTKNAVYGKTFPLFTVAYARKNNIPRIYSDEPEKSTLELQMMFHDCIRGLSFAV